MEANEKLVSDVVALVIPFVQPGDALVFRLSNPCNGNFTAEMRISRRSGGLTCLPEVNKHLSEPRQITGRDIITILERIKTATALGYEDVTMAQKEPRNRKWIFVLPDGG
jgi:hypothetical protein